MWWGGFPTRLEMKPCSYTMCTDLPSGSMGDVLCPLLAGDLDLATGDAGSGDGGAQQVAVLIDGVGLHQSPDELFYKLSTQVLNEHLSQTHTYTHRFILTNDL